MNKKVVRIFEPGMRLYFIIMVLFVGVSALCLDRKWIAITEGGVVLALLIYFFAVGAKRRHSILEHIATVTDNVDSAGKDSVANFPLPTIIVMLDTEQAVWSNDKFRKISGEGDHFFETKIGDIVPNFSTRWLLEGKSECPSLVELNDRQYRVFGNIVRPDKAERRTALVGTTYWMDVTDHVELKEKYANSRPIVGIIMLDNYDELVKNQSTASIAILQAEIEERISAWCDFSSCLLSKFDRDRYVIVFEEESLRQMTEQKFSLLDTIRETTNPAGIAATVSIGLGKDGESFAEDYQFASLSVEMALSRGGDQAVIRNRFNFEFYGGRSKETEKRTKVKSRVMASALGELMTGASRVFVMGHSLADLDAVGAAVGVCCIARKRGKKARIVIDLNKNASKSLIARLQAVPEYADSFISPQEAMVQADPRTLLVVVDTNRPEQVESQELLLSCNHVAVIDHHRRAATYIASAALNFHEPSASSTSELVTELLQYLTEQTDLLKVEAESLMAGIVLDTKNFSLRVGGRTFDAAGFLRRCGADPTDVKKLMQSDFESTVERYEIVSHAQMVRKGISVAPMRRTVDRITAAQAADELLEIAGIDASFVMYPDGERVMVSARSLNENVNVQMIMEKLGGGGNNAAAAAQMQGYTIDEAYDALLQALTDYLA